MIAYISPGTLEGVLPAIPSKSVAHRALIASALSSGVTRVQLGSSCDDIDATISCLSALGARCEKSSQGIEIHPIPKSQEYGLLKALHGRTLDCRESASTLRFLLPVSCALGARASFTGSSGLAQRPISQLVEELLAAGCNFSEPHALPLRTAGRLRNGTYTLPGDISSQYISGLLLALPLLPGQSCIEVAGVVQSRPYIDLTVRVLASFGVAVQVETLAGEPPITRFIVEGTGYRTPGSYEIEGDWSNAAFWLCAGALGTSPIGVKGLSLGSAQGDRSIVAVLSRFGARVRHTSGVAIVQPDHLHGFSMDASHIPDLVPIIAAVGSVAEGTTTIQGCERLRIKESNRLATTIDVLSRLGADIKEQDGSLIIQGRPKLTGGVVDAHQDHRIAMMAAIAAIRCEQPVELRGAQAISKSYPQFFEHHAHLGGHVVCHKEG